MVDIRTTRTRIGGPGDGPYAVAVDPQGAVWVTLIHAGHVARITGGREVTLYDLGNPHSRPAQLAVDNDGALWFTRSGDDRIDRLTADGDRRSYPLPAGSGPYGVCAGPDGAIWYTALWADAIGRLDPDGTVATFDVPGGGMPSMITSGPAEALWFTLNRSGAIGRLNPADGAIVLHALADPDCGPVGIAGGQTGLWFVEINAGRVGRRTPAGEWQEFDLPDRDARPHAVTPAYGGGCWVTLWGRDAVARLTEHGELVGLHPLGEGDEPHGITTGPDGIVVVALVSGYVARLVPHIDLKRSER